MDSSDNKPKHITLLTGFLGAGKTTFLNEWLHYFSDKKILVVENEVGEVNIDTQLIERVEPTDIFSLTGGCACCSLSEEFSDLLADIWEKRKTFDEIIVEATGVANPQHLLRPFKQRQSMANYYIVDRVICLVDALWIISELETTDIAKQQIVGSDIILLSKTDSVTPQQLVRLRLLLQQINPFAQIFDGNKWEGFPIKKIANCKADKALPDISIVENEGNKEKVQLHKHEHGAISTLHFSFEDPFDLDELKYRLLVFLNFQASEIYRIKGILYVEGGDKKVIVQTVADIVTFDEQNTWGIGEKKKSDIVIIGKNLLSKGFEKMLSNCIHHSFKKLPN